MVRLEKLPTGDSRDLRSDASSQSLGVEARVRTSLSRKRGRSRKGNTRFLKRTRKMTERFICAIGVLNVLGWICMTLPVFAYEVATHQRISQKAAEQSILSSYL